MPSVLDTVNKKSSVPNMVKKILAAQDSTWKKQIRLVPSNVESVVALRNDTAQYLLYSPDFFNKLPQEDIAIAYGIIAHAIAHFQSGHLFDPAFALKEESEADGCMGFMLASIPGISLEAAINVVVRMPFGNRSNLPERQESIKNGWNRNLALKALEGFNFNGNVNAEYQTVPQFPWPPPDCSQSIPLLSTKALSDAYPSMKAVDNAIGTALDRLGYSQRAYFQTPNGFAVVTQMEQFDIADGRSAPDKDRWKDYPVRNFSTLVEYFKAIIMPEPGHFRIFVFLISTEDYQTTGNRPSKEEATAWLRDGCRNRLPQMIAQKTLTPQHYIDLLVYEFEALQTDKRCYLKCPSLLNGSDHYKKSGLSNQLRF